MVVSGEGSFGGFNMFCVRGIPGCRVCDRKLLHWCGRAASRNWRSRWWNARLDQGWQADIFILCNAGHAGFKASQDISRLRCCHKDRHIFIFCVTFVPPVVGPLLVPLSYLRWWKNWNVLFWDKDASHWANASPTHQFSFCSNPKIFKRKARVKLLMYIKDFLSTFTDMWMISVQGSELKRFYSII